LNAIALLNLIATRFFIYAKIIMMEVFIIASITADGLIGQNTDQSSMNWTSKADKQFFIQKTKEAGAVVMGRKTFDTIAPKYRPLKNRLNIIYTRQNLEDFIEHYQVQNREDVLVTQDEPQKLIQQLEEEGQQQVAICGGSSIYTMFMKAGVVNKLYLTVEPIVFGSGVKLFNEELDNKLKLNKVGKLGDEGTVLLEYLVG